MYAIRRLQLSSSRAREDACGRPPMSMNPLNWAFRSGSVKATLQALDDLRPVFAKNFSASLVVDEVWAQARSALINNPEQVSRTVDTEATPARTACLMLIVKITRLDLASGHDHIWRGVLSMQGEGKKLIYDIAMAELERAGACTAEVRRFRAAELAQDIAEVG